MSDKNSNDPIFTSLRNYHVAMLELYELTNNKLVKDNLENEKKLIKYIDRYRAEKHLTDNVRLVYFIPFAKYLNDNSVYLGLKGDTNGFADETEVKNKLEDIDDAFHDFYKIYENLLIKTPSLVEWKEPETDNMTVNLNIEKLLKYDFQIYSEKYKRHTGVKFSKKFAQFLKIIDTIMKERLEAYDIKIDIQRHSNANANAVTDGKSFIKINPHNIKTTLKNKYFRNVKGEFLHENKMFNLMVDIKILEEIYVHELTHIIISNTPEFFNLAGNLATRVDNSASANPANSANSANSDVQHAARHDIYDVKWHDFIIFNSVMYLLNMYLFGQLNDQFGCGTEKQDVNQCNVITNFYMLMETEFFRSEVNVLTYFDDTKQGNYVVLHRMLGRGIKEYDRLMDGVIKQITGHAEHLRDVV